MSTLKITSRRPPACEVLLDGVDISRSLRSMHIDLDPRLDGPKVTAEFITGRGKSGALITESREVHADDLEVSL